MSKITIDLPPVLAEFLENQVDAGLYNSTADAVQDAVRKLYEDDGFRVEAVRQGLAPGVAEADAGVYFEGTIDDIIAEAKAARPKQK